MSKSVAEALLKLEAVHLRPNDFFTWTSGVKSPIYCDNRRIISAPDYRQEIVKGFVEIIRKSYPDTNCIAGTATAGIPWAAWIAHEMNLPMIYIRSSAKSHGLKSAIEGHPNNNSKVVIIEDLISTGKSAIAAADEVNTAGLKLLGVVSIFTYGLEIARTKFSEKNIESQSLCSLEELLTYAGEKKLLSNEEIEIIRSWRNTIELT